MTVNIRTVSEGGRTRRARQAPSQGWDSGNSDVCLLMLCSASPPVDPVLTRVKAQHSNDSNDKKRGGANTWNIVHGLMESSTGQVHGTFLLNKSMH